MQYFFVRGVFFKVVKISHCLFGHLLKWPQIGTAPVLTVPPHNQPAMVFDDMV